MARYTHESIERVRDAVDMVDLVQAKTELRRSGSASFTGLCPFHDERSPSFSVDPLKKVFHCFGCGEGGDLFKFVELTEGVTFREALELLGDRYSVVLELDAEDPQAAQRREQRERLLELLERTAAFYVRMLWESDEASDAREYLAERGLEESYLREFRVGYAPSDWGRVMTGSRQAGFSERELLDAGLIQRSQKGQTYDRFRRRIMFPLCDVRGRVLGFGARALGADQKPKYLNSADGPVYHKGHHVFAADLARAAAAKAGEAILCEGYTDVIALHQAGLRNTVGLMGTALTEDQVGELARLAPRVLLALDADSAGQGAMLRAAQVAAGRRLELRVVPLPPGSDPADIVAAGGGQAVRDLVSASMPFVRFRVERALSQEDLSDPEAKDRVVGELRPVFSTLGPGALRDDLLELAAGRLDVVPTKLAEWLAAAPRVPAPAAPGAAPAPSRDAPAPVQRTILDPPGRIERQFLVQCLALPADGREKLASLDIDQDFTAAVHRRAAKLLRDHLGEDRLEAPDDEELTRTLAELQVRATHARGSRAALEAEHLRLQLTRVEREIQAAKRSGGGELVRLVELRERLRGAVEREVEKTLIETRPVED
jgi:DNA primase